MMKISPDLAAPVLDILYRMWCATLRLRETGREAVDALEKEGKPMMFSLWHDELFTLMHVRRSLKLVTVVSRSRDGEYLARVLQSLGLKTARGSSSRGALGALLQAARIMREEKYNGVLTVDGPTGPRHKVKQGAVILAHRTPAHLVPVRLFPRRAKVFRSWDRFQLPLPFSRVDIVFGAPYRTQAKDLSEPELEKACQELEERLTALNNPEIGSESICGAVQYRLFRFLAACFSRLPWSALRATAFFMGALFWHVARARREEAVRAVQKHLRKNREEATRIARQSFKENFLSFLEIFHAGQFYTGTAVKQLFTPEVKAQLQAEKAPVIIATAHLGSWELMPGLATDITPDREGMVVVRNQKNRALNRIMADLRGARGMLAIGHREASSIVVPKLRKGGVAAFLVDHNTARKEAVFLPFLEDAAAVNMGPASLALRTKAAVYPVFLVRDGQGGHILHMLPPLRAWELEGGIQERTREIARFYTDAVASMVRQYPEQWFWMHRRWKTREK
jgi:lauroyl/myristoyl acyltransferase/lysophospholipid acyltransferase (LPLAT)-like uncharacterized protein